MNNMKNWNFEKFFSAEYWSKLFRASHPISARLHKIMRICLSSIRGFTDDDCSDKASALTFYTLLSIIPVLAVAFGIAKGFGFEEHLQAEIMQRFSDQHEIADKLIDFSTRMLKNTQSGLIAGVGLVVLFWSVLKLMGSIESSFNAIWKIKKPRSWGRRFSDYLALMLFCPIFLAISGSFTVFLNTEFLQITETNDVLKAVSPLFILAVHLFPLILSWMLFTALYYIMPNAKVPFSSAFTAGIAAGTIYQIVQWIYIQFQIGLASYGAIYGSFAALPLFLIWLNTSWYIALIGAEVAYHTENDIMMSGESTISQQRHVDARVLGLLIMQQSVEAFRQGVRPPTVYNLAKATGISVQAAKMLVYQFIQSGLLVEITWRDGSGGYFQPGRDIKTIKIKDVSDALDSSRHERYLIIHTNQADNFEQNLAALDKLLQNADTNYSLDQING